MLHYPKLSTRQRTGHHAGDPLQCRACTLDFKTLCIHKTSHTLSSSNSSLLLLSPKRAQHPCLGFLLLHGSSHYCTGLFLYSLEVRNLETRCYQNCISTGGFRKVFSLLEPASIPCSWPLSHICPTSCSYYISYYSLCLPPIRTSVSPR